MSAVHCSFLSIRVAKFTRISHACQSPNFGNCPWRNSTKVRIVPAAFFWFCTAIWLWLEDNLYM